MRRAGEIYEYLKELAPLELQMDFDNSGFQLGRLDAFLIRRNIVIYEI